MVLNRPHQAIDRCGRRRAGNVLLLSLLILSSMIVAAAGLGTLILSSLQQTRAIDNAIIAQAAAESGIEQGLYLSRCRHAQKDIRCDGTVPAAVTAPQSLGNGSKWSTEVADSEMLLYYYGIPQDGTVEIALFNPDGEYAATDIDEVRMTWDPPQLGDSYPLVHASITAWAADSGALAWSTLRPPDQDKLNEVSFMGNSAVIALPWPRQPARLRLRVERAALKNVRVSAYKTEAGTEQRVPLPARIRIDASGDYVGVRQKITARMPRPVPLSGLFDFVIFSQCSLVKGMALMNCQ